MHAVQPVGYGLACPLQHFAHALEINEKAADSLALPLSPRMEFVGQFLNRVRVGEPPANCARRPPRHLVGRPRRARAGGQTASGRMVPTTARAQMTPKNWPRALKPPTHLVHTLRKGKQPFITKL
eukprot:SAG11_NODE_8744_length_980_cov_10.992054_1_plen_125_part_00